MSIGLTELKKISGKAYALFGYPLSHSMSEELHSLLNSDIPYYCVEVKPDEISEALLVAKEKLLGFNVTIPYKNTIAKELNEDFAVNTVAIKNGEFYAQNTDVLALKYLLSKIIKKGDKAVILGGGGAAAAAVKVLKELGADITVAVRNVEKTDLSVKVVNINELSGSFDILINCTPVGMYKNEGVSTANLDKVNVSYVFDVIYNPLETKLLADARKRGIPCQNGLMMLILQGAFAQTFWNGKGFNNLDKIYDKLSVSLLKKRLSEVYNKENILLFGFMGCGKTTVGKMLSDILEFSFIDTDQLIEDEQKLSISEIFEKYGEDKFRQFEQIAIKKALMAKNAVIAVGGGAPFYDNNSEIMKENAVCVFLDAPFDELYKRICTDKKRPKLDSFDNTKKLFDKRLPGYKKLADIEVSSNEENKMAKIIIEKI